MRTSRKSLSQTANAKFRDTRPVFNFGRPLIKLQTNLRFGTGRPRRIAFARLPPFVRTRRAELAMDPVALDRQAQADSETSPVV